MKSRRVPIPLTFFVVVAVTIILIVFFGAWAVSADAADQEQTLAFGFVAGSDNLNANAPGSSQLKGLEASGREENSISDSADSWWGQAFLKACPLH